MFVTIIMGVKFYSLNVRGINNKIKRRLVFKQFRKLNADIICLQETYCSDDKERFWSTEWGARAIYANGESNARGVAILFRRNFSCQILRIDRDPKGRFLIATIKTHGREIVISNVYAPNEDKPQFFHKLFKNLQIAHSPEWLLAGDFNLVFDMNLDRRSISNVLLRKKAAESLENIMQVNELYDVWCKLHPDVKRYTCHSSAKSASRIDFFLVSHTLFNYVTKADILSSAISDHSIIYLELDLVEELRGKGLWSLNTKWLQNSEYKELVCKSVEAVIAKNNQEQLNPSLSWEMIKNEITGCSIQFSFKQAKVKNEAVNELELQLDSLYKYADSLNAQSPQLSQIQS